MKENERFVPENREILPNSRFTITVIGDAVSGKTTLLRYIKDRGYDVDTEPDNPLMELFIENPKKYAFQNQVYKSAQLMEREAVAAQSKTLSNPYFRETGLLGTDIYNRYLCDQGLITKYEFDLLDKLYNHNMHLLSDPDLIVYLYADDDIIRERALKRDGVVAHDPQMLQPYWDRLLANLENSGTPVLRLNTGENSVEVTARTIMKEVEETKDTDDSPAAEPPQQTTPPQRKDPSKTSEGPDTMSFEKLYMSARFAAE